MKTENQRMAIAEACGWTQVCETGDGCIWGQRPTNHNEQGIYGSAEVPDYLNDLNAMHEAEKVLTDRERQCVRYVDELMAVLIRAHPQSLDPSRFGMISATASQRAEAFLRSLSKWEESA